MNEMTENNLDKLIEETLERRQLIADLDKLIIADLHRHERRTWIRRWTRTVAFLLLGLQEQFAGPALADLCHRAEKTSSKL